MSDIGVMPLVGSAFFAVAWIIRCFPIEALAIHAKSQRARDWSRIAPAGFFALTGGVLLLLALRNISQLEPDQIFNLFEGYLWIAISASLFVIRQRHPAQGPENRLATVSFFLFGVSDLIEMHTGAWYRPWPLLALKAACVLGLLIALAWRTTSKRRRTTERLP